MAVTVKPREKIYYNIDITSNAKPGDFTSEAKFDVVLNQALIENVSDYQFLVQKFKIDSESIPLFYVDLQQPQPPVSNNTNFITNYNIYAVTGGLLPTLYSVPVLYSAPANKPARIARTEGLNVYYDNRDLAFAIFSYDYFVTCINNALVTLFQKMGSGSQPPLFQYDHVLGRICYYNTSFTNTSPAIYFSINLHPYIGEAFNMTWHFVRPALITEDVYSIIVEQNPLLQNVVTMGGVPMYKTVQEYAAMSSWASISRILIVSNKLPIRREFYPAANNNDGILKHNKQSYVDLVSMNIITSFLFTSTDPGDYRTSIVYSTPTIDNADLIEMSQSGAIREIDIEVLWSDKYGNVFPIQLGPTKQVNLRLAFVKK